MNDHHLCRSATIVSYGIAGLACTFAATCFAELCVVRVNSLSFQQIFKNHFLIIFFTEIIQI